MRNKKEDISGVHKCFRERDLLANAIADAARKSGIYNGEVYLDGPKLLLVLGDMADEILRLRKELNGEWKEWNGGDIPPYIEGLRCDIKFRDGTVLECENSDDWCWSWGDAVSSESQQIVAYREASYGY